MKKSPSFLLMLAASILACSFYPFLPVRPLTVQVKSRFAVNTLATGMAVPRDIVFTPAAQPNAPLQQPSAMATAAGKNKPAESPARNPKGIAHYRANMAGEKEKPAHRQSAKTRVTLNPVLYADVPDMAMIRVGNSYYMSSTTMHLSPGIPIMKSKDLVNWRIVNYAYDALDSADALNLSNGKSAYGAGSWASSLRYHRGIYYVTTFSNTTGKTYIYTTKNIEKGPWKAVSFRRRLHDHSLFFDDDGRVYMISGSGKISLTELNESVSDIKPGTSDQVIIENASAPAGPDIGLRAEGSQMFRINGKYYLFNITWPRGGMRTVVIHRADKITGPYEGRVALQDKGVAQGGLINTRKGEWFAYLFRDYGAVGRTPYLVPVKWENGWPVPGVDGKAPDTLNLPPGRGDMPGIVASDEFDRQPGQPALPLVWQWNHHPDNTLWSLSKKRGWLRLTTGRADSSVLLARNTLTQRSFGPVCSGATAVEVSHMKEGDRAGLLLLQKNYGWVGVKADAGSKFVVMINAASGTPVEAARFPLTQSIVYLRADCDFRDRTDKAYFYYSLNGKTWTLVGSPLQMTYTLPHFMGYRFGLFNYAEKTAGGWVDVDFFHLSNKIIAPPQPVATTQPAMTPPNFSAYLFAYFTGNKKEQESIHFAISDDGYHFRALNGNNPVLLSEKISSTGGVRDPHILRGADGKTFYMAATDMVSALGWNSNRAMVLLKSTDLINWTSSVVNIQTSFPGNDSLLRVWAPQTIYDPAAKKYMIYFSMKHGSGPDKIYYAYANDEFTGLATEPKQLFYHPQNGSCIDGDIEYAFGKYHLFFKTEGQGNGIKKAVSEKLTGGYVMEDRYLQQTTEAVEGAGTFRLNNSDEWILMYDVYKKGKYQFTRSKDLENFKEIDNEMSMNFHPRHGTVMPITAGEARRLTQQWPPVEEVASASHR